MIFDVHVVAICPDSLTRFRQNYMQRQPGKKIKNQTRLSEKI